MPRPKPVVLIVLDGWGVAPASPTNAITQAKLPVFSRLIADYPVVTLQSSGEAVGLLWGEMGNSEVGHLNMGSGRIVYQSLARINRAISDGSFANAPALVAAFDHVKKNAGARLHLVGLVSNGGVHSHLEHLNAILDCCQANGVSPAVHAVLDGRDTTRDAGAGFIEELHGRVDVVGGCIATVSGRYWAMDRDNHWERIERAFRAMCEGVGESEADPVAAVRQAYARGVYDEEFPPTVIAGADGSPAARVRDGDAVVFFNFRADRMRQLATCFVLPGFAKFERAYLRNLLVVTMTEYDRDLPVSVMFGPEYVREPVAKVIAEAGLRQFHIAETEKYAHVTFFFNGGREEPFAGEERALVPSPRVSSYAECPEMSAYALTDRLISEIRRGAYDFVVVNYANADMVGHTGNLSGTVKAVEAIDACLGRVLPAVLEAGGVAIVTADHGNAENLLDLQTGEMNKEHSTNPVPCIFVGNAWVGRSASGSDAIGGDLSTVTPSGVLADIGPTILNFLLLPIPGEMTGRPLI